MPIINYHSHTINARNCEKVKLTNETSWSLLHDFHTERSGHVWFVTVTLNGNVLGCIESFVRTTTVGTLHIGLRRTLITSDRKYWMDEENCELILIISYFVSQHCWLIDTPINNQSLMTYHLRCTTNRKRLKLRKFYLLPLLKTITVLDNTKK